MADTFPKMLAYIRAGGGRQGEGGSVRKEEVGRKGENNIYIN